MHATGRHSSHFLLADALAMVFLGAITLAVFAHACRNQFVKFDDQEYVAENTVVQGGLNSEGIRYAFTTTEGANWHPLTWLSLELDAEIFSLQAWGFHFTNVLLHVANTLLLFWVLRRMTGYIWRSALVAALFAVHPLHVESVAWVSERKDVLSTFFWMLTLLAYVRYVERPGMGRYGLVALALALGLLAKPMLVTLPCVLLLLDYWPLRRFSLGSANRGKSDPLTPTPLPRVRGRGALIDDGLGQDRRRTPGFLVLEKVPLLLLSAVGSLTTWYAQTRTMMSWQDYPLHVRVGNALTSYGLYIVKTIWPVNLAAFYPHPRGGLPTWQIATAALALGVTTLVVLWMVRRRPYLAVGWFWYLGTLVPVIGLIQVGRQGMADRYTYIPLIGLFILATWAIADLAERLRIQKPALAVASALLLVFMLHSWIQVSYWHDTESLWQHTLLVTERNALAEAGMGMVHDDKGELDKALQHFRTALAIEPNDAKTHNLVGQDLFAQNKLDEALAEFRETLRLEPGNSMAEYNLGLVYGARGDVAKAVEHFGASVQLNPGNPIGQYNLGRTLLDAGKPQEASDHLSQALQLYAAEAERLENQAAALRARGNAAEAALRSKKVQDIRLEMAEMHCRLAEAALSISGREEAKQHYQIALQLNPKNDGALDGLAGIYLATGYPGEVAKIYGGDPALLQNKGLAYRNLGRAAAQQEKWEEAAAWYSRGLSLPGLVPGTQSGFRGGLALALAKLGRRDEARTQFHEAVRLDPRWPQVTRLFAWTLATNPTEGLRNGPLALDLAQQVCQSTDTPDPQSLDVLAASYAEVGRFSEATATAHKALAGASASGLKTLAEAIQRRLQLYENRQPFHGTAAHQD
jgi:tetratricopeptide (TPR) repeat protein